MKNIKKGFLLSIAAILLSVGGCTSQRYAVGPASPNVIVVHKHPRVYHARVYHPKVVVVKKQPHR